MSGALAAREWLATGLCGQDRVYRWMEGALGSLRGGMVLAFHQMPTESFVAQIRALGETRIVPLDELIARLKARKPTAGLFAITFDDGVGDVTRQVASFATQHQFPVTCYLPTAYLDDPGALAFQTWECVRVRLPSIEVRLRTRVLDLSSARARQQFVAEITDKMYTAREETFAPLVRELADHLLEHGLATADQLRAPDPISWDEVTELSRNPLVRFESHGVSHRAMAGLGADELDRELRDSQRAIEDHTSVRCRHFCYPYGGMGSIGAIAPSIAAKYYDSAVTMVRGRVGGKDPMLLPRVPIYARDTGNVARLKAITAR